MARECGACAHPGRASIELGLANKVGMPTLGRRYELSRECLYRHRHTHMPPQLMAALMMRGKPTEKIHDDH